MNHIQKALGIPLKSIEPLSNFSSPLFDVKEVSSSVVFLRERLVYNHEEFTGHENAAYQDV